MVAQAFNKLFALVTLFNFGPDTTAPRFTFSQMEELHKDRADRDKILYEMGARFNIDYLSEHYQIDPSHVEIQDTESAFQRNGNTLNQQFSRRTNNETVEDFTARLEKQGQDTLDTMIDEFQKEIDKSKSFEDAAKRILNRHKKQFKHRSKLAETMNNLRYVAASSGASNTLMEKS